MALENTFSSGRMGLDLFYLTDFMHLREGEQILQIFHHHPTPFVFNILKLIAATLPFFLLIFVFQESLSTSVFVLINLGVFLLFALVVIYLSLIYWLDKLVVTNFRVVHIDWKYLTVRDEAEGLIDDIQDIQTEEKGLLSYLKVFDYGSISIDTASSHVTLIFRDAPDPEGIRRFIYHVRQQ